MKMGGNGLAGVGLADLLAKPSLLLLNLPLFGGYCLYGISTVLLVLALRQGQLSVLYPVIALTYVWVLLLSIVVFSERLNLFKVAGVMAIVAGVGVLGRDDRR